MPHYPDKPARQVLAGMINEANGTQYKALQFECGVPNAIAGPADRNTEIPVVFSGGPLAHGALESVQYKRLSLNDIFAPVSVRVTDEGFLRTKDLLESIARQYNVVIQADDIVDALLPTQRPSTVTVAAHANSVMFTGQFQLELSYSSVDWTVPLTENAVQLFNTSTPPFNGDWFCDTSWKSQGVYSLRASDITAGQTSSTYIDVLDGTGRKICFDYRVSSEPDYDRLRLFVNDVQVWSISGDQAGTYTFSLPAGPTHVEWRYTKDGSTDGGFDTAWIDRVRLFTARIIASGILVSNTHGTMATQDLERYHRLDAEHAPALVHVHNATWAAADPAEIVALNGFSDRIELQASFDYTRSWIKRSFTSLLLAGEQSVFFKSKLYFAAQDRNSGAYGLYRLDRVGVGESATFLPVNVLALTQSDAAITANLNTIAVFDQSLHTSADGESWSTRAVVHPYATGGGNADMERVQLALIAGQLVGVGRVVSTDVTAPTLAMFVGGISSTFTWKPVEPWGVGVKALPVQFLLKVFTFSVGVDRLILTASEPYVNGVVLTGGDTFVSTNLGDSWQNVDANHGIHPVTIADDGERMMITGFRQRTGLLHWQSMSYDRGRTWQHDSDENSFLGANQTEYTYALGVVPASVGNVED